MGRKKISISRINNDRLRTITFTKRRRGLIKKAMELSLLCGSSIVMCIEDEATGQTLTYSSKLDPKLLSQGIPKVDLVDNDYERLFVFRESEAGVNKKLEKAEEIKSVKEIGEKLVSNAVQANVQPFHEKLKRKASGLKLLLNTPPKSYDPTAMDRGFRSAPPVFSTNFSTTTELPFPKPTKFVNHGMMGSMPVGFYDESYGGLCLPAFRPCETAFNHSPLQFAGNVYRRYYEI
eukprot:TRINITY_DN2599_c0_g2_i1.p1 TRINITY_DN2599_c0_g2~~TRINITY_DN2599_c0_g2_i1.p1  ORF type:complete len:234 (+),score=33.40 TRINITY_DN2599_c0_g2_i1:107-808(+)